MALAIILVLLVVGSVVFHIVSPWWFTEIASNWSAMDATINLTVWVTGIVFVIVNLFVYFLSGLFLLWFFGILILDFLDFLFPPLIL